MVDNIITQLDIKELIEGSPFFRQFFQSIHQVIWVLNPNKGQIVYASPSFETVWGYTSESLYSDPLNLIKSIHPEDRVKVLSDSITDTHKSLIQSYRIIRPDGNQRWISAQTFLVQDEVSGNGYEVSIAQDVTAQNKVDQTLHESLDHSRERFTISRRMSLAHNPEAVLKTLMSASELRSAQNAFVLFFGSPTWGPSHEIEVIASWASNSYPPKILPYENQFDTALFGDLDLLDLFHPSKAVIITDISKDQRLTPIVRELLQKRKIETLATFPMIALGNWLGCFLLFFKEEYRFEPVKLRHIKVLVDQATITLYNLQLLEIEAVSRHEAEQANEIKTRFLAMISHELRTPLTSIKGFTTTLLAEDVVWEADEQRDFIQTIDQEANRLQELIDHLLDLSRIEAGMMSIVKKSFTLQEIIEDSMPQLKVLTSGQKLFLHLPANLPALLVDGKRIAQVLVNLVRNAATYAPKGTVINISASVHGSFIQINVADQGPGIPPAERKHVFQAFVRGVREENRMGKGAGLGLAICKGLVESHGGRIWIRKKSSPGTTVSFTLPIVTQDVGLPILEKV